MKTSFKILGIAVMSLGLSLSSCKKDKDDDSLSTDNIVAHDNMESTATTEDISASVQQMMAENETAINGRVAVEGDTIIRTKGIDDCATVTIIRSQKKITVDFGTTGCVGRNGRARIGKWNITYTSHWKNPGAEIHISFDGFAFKRPNGIAFIQVSNESHKKITTLSAENGVYEFKKEINLVTTLPTGQTRSITGTRYVTWNTSLTADRFDDIITIKTTSNEIGTDRKGRSYNVAVLDPVVILTSCWLEHFYKPVSGTVQISKIGKTKTITFGNGFCGGDITVDVEGKKSIINEGE